MCYEKAYSCKGFVCAFGGEYGVFEPDASWIASSDEVNSNPEAVSKMERLKDIITLAKKEKTDENNRNLMELNDYIKNYSDLTFNEYKQLKNKK